MTKLQYYLKIAGLVVLVSLIYLILALQLVNAQKIAWGIEIANLPVGGRDMATAQQILEKQWGQFSQQETILVYQDKTWLINLTDLGFQLNSPATLRKAYQISHPSNHLIEIKNQLAALASYYHLKPIYQIDLDKFQEKTAQLFENIEKPAQNASLVFSPELDDFVLEHSTKGTKVDRKQLLNNLSEQIESFSLKPINLELILDQPSIENHEVGQAQEKARQILTYQPYQLIFEGRSWKIDKKTLIDWIKFEPIKEENSDNQILGLTLDNEKVKKYLSKIAAGIDQPVTNAQLKTQGNRATIFIPDQEGFEVKKDLTFNKLVENLLADPPIKKTYIIADKALPKIKLSQTNRLGINTLLGQGISNFAGSPNNRKHNIKTAVAKLNGYILNPEEEFSFNAFLGETGPEQGYLAELVIKKNKTTPEYGGGVCQVSTTFFRAAVKAGLKITERQAHAFPVEYYNPQGFDATVYNPKPDLRFINNTPAHLLIQAYTSGNQVIVNFYGTDDSRQVKIKGPYLLEKNEDGSMKTVLTQEVYQKGELIEKQIFYSNYKSPDLYPIETEILKRIKKNQNKAYLVRHPYRNKLCLNPKFFF
jgi:vancomycin resistance protein YoaR